MGEALLRGFFNASISSPGRISCSVNTLERRQALEGMGVVRARARPVPCAAAGAPVATRVPGWCRTRGQLVPL